MLRHLKELSSLEEAEPRMLCDEKLGPEEVLLASSFPGEWTKGCQESELVHLT